MSCNMGRDPVREASPKEKDHIFRTFKPTFRTTIAKIDNFAPQGTISGIMAVAIKISYQ
jgi:hypothetical protein